MLTQIIPSVLYLQYRDDKYLQSFVDSYNSYSQEYVDTFVDLNFPIYNTKTELLLDWVGANIYGIFRPVLSEGTAYTKGAINTWAFDSIAFNGRKRRSNSTYTPTTDDVYKRVITWHHWRGDGEYFNMAWLKRRIMRFLTNADVSQTYDISVTFSGTNDVDISIPAASFETDIATIFKTALESGVLATPFQYQFNVTVT